MPNIMREFRIDEISGVDVPAQQPATVSIMKRAEITKDGGQTMSEETTTTEETTTATADPKVSRAQLEADNQRMSAIIGLSAEERAHFDALPEGMRDSFLGKSADDRRAEMVAKSAADPVVYTTMDGVEIRKSAGDVVLSLAKSNDALKRSNDEMVKAAEQQALEKRAETELSHIPGDVATRAAMLKAMDGIADEEVRKNAMAALRSKNEVGKAAFATLGSTGGAFEATDSEDALDKLAKGIAEKEGMDYHTAYAKAMTSPEGRELYNKSLREASSR